MFKVVVLANFIVLVIYWLVSRFIEINHWSILPPLLISTFIFEFGAIYLMRKRSSGEVKDLGPSAEEEDSSTFHNDFSKVESGDPNIAVKPVDLTGNVFEHNFETLQEDLENIGIKKSKKKSKE